jgi:hypothetical protein
MNLPADASTDQENCPPDYYRRNNGMLHQIPKDSAPIAIADSPTPSELALLDTLPPKLQSLCKRICMARWGEVALMSQTQIAEAIKLRLAHGGLTIEHIDKALPLMKEWCDRVEGKSVERIDSRTVVIHTQEQRRKDADAEAEEMLALLAKRLT